VEPAILEQFYGIKGQEKVQKPGRTGAGCADDEEIALAANNIAESQRSNIRHEGVEVPHHEHPFQLPGTFSAFKESLKRVKESQILPPNFGIRPEEYETYPASEVIQAGRRGKGGLTIALPFNIWRPRAELWCQALSTMLHFVELM
jgi:hypothetical protein